MKKLTRLELANLLESNLNYFGISYIRKDIRYRSHNDDCYKSSYRYCIPKDNGYYSVADVLDDTDVRPYEHYDYYQVASNTASSDIGTVLDSHHSGYIHIPRI